GCSSGRVYDAEGGGAMASPPVIRCRYGGRRRPPYRFLAPVCQLQSGSSTRTGGFALIAPANEGTATTNSDPPRNQSARIPTIIAGEPGVSGTLRGSTKATQSPAA